MLSISRTDREATLQAEGGATSNRGWLTVDLAELAGRVGPLPVTPVPAPALAAPALVCPPAEPEQDNEVVAVPPVETSPTAGLPLDRFVVIGSGPAPRRGVGRRRVVPSIANDNARSRARAGKRPALREIFFLAVLAATLVGAFYSGRVHGIQKVIIVPDAMSRRSVVT